MLLMIDNYDSFTYNLVQYLGELGERVAVYRNDQLTLNDLAEDPSYADDLACCHRALTGIVDPDAANQTALADQARRIAELGGVERIMASEEFDHTPVPV